MPVDDHRNGIETDHKVDDDANPTRIRMARVHRQSTGARLSIGPVWLSLRTWHSPDTLSPPGEERARRPAAQIPEDKNPGHQETGNDESAK